jgi:hypothetical protein
VLEELLAMTKLVFVSPNRSLKKLSVSPNWKAPAAAELVMPNIIVILLADALVLPDRKRKFVPELLMTMEPKDWFALAAFQRLSGMLLLAVTLKMAVSKAPGLTPEPLPSALVAQ